MVSISSRFVGVGDRAAGQVPDRAAGALDRALELADATEGEAGRRAALARAEAGLTLGDGVDRSGCGPERVGHLTEGLELIKRLWTEDSVTHHGKHFRLDDARASVRPKQSPRPPIWLGGDVEPAVRRAARIADAWCIAPTLSIGSMLTRLEVFRDERRQIGQPEDVSCRLIRECFVGRDGTQRRSAAGRCCSSTVPTLPGVQRETGSDFDAAFDDFGKGRFLIGEVEQVRDEILRYAEIARTDHFLLRVQWPGLATKRRSATSSGSAGSSQPSAEIAQEGDPGDAPRLGVALMSNRISRSGLPWMTKAWLVDNELRPSSDRPGLHHVVVGRAHGRVVGGEEEHHTG